MNKKDQNLQKIYAGNKPIWQKYLKRTIRTIGKIITSTGIKHTFTSRI